MKPLKPEEEWARQMIATTLGCPVEQHDDNRSDSLYDLRVLHTDSHLAAVEVTAAADAASIELWNLVNGNDVRWQVDELVGGWSVVLLPTARGRRVLRELPAFLAEMEAADVRSVRGRHISVGRSLRALPKCGSTRRRNTARTTPEPST